MQPAAAASHNPRFMVQHTFKRGSESTYFGESSTFSYSDMVNFNNHQVCMTFALTDASAKPEITLQIAIFEVMHEKRTGFRFVILNEKKLNQRNFSIMITSGENYERRDGNILLRIQNARRGAF